MLEWFANKSQIDFGNFAVGIATIFVALSTLFVAKNSLRLAREQKIWDQRKDLIDKLHVSIADFVELSNERALLLIRQKNEDKLELDEFYGNHRKLMAKFAYITMALDGEDKSSAELFECMNAALHSETADDINWGKLVGLGRNVLEVERLRLNNEIKG